MSSIITPTFDISPTSTATVSAAASADPTCIQVTPGRHDYVPPFACNAVWNYDVSFPAAVLFSALFGMVTLAHLILAVVHKKRFAWVIIMACSWELAAFVLRAYGALHQLNNPVATISQILVLLAPLLINAFVYMILGRMIYFYIPTQSCFGIPAVRLAKIFVWLDVFSFLVQLGGGVLIQPGQDPKTLKLGIKIYETGVGVQQFFVVIFTAVAVRFHIHMNQLERGMLAKPRWKALLYTCYTVLALITMRIIYRLFELNAGVSNDGSNPLLFHEVYFYCLEATPMVLAIALLAVIHPGLGLKGPDSEFPKLTRKEKKAIKAAKKAEKKAEKQRIRDDEVALKTPWEHEMGAV